MSAPDLDKADRQINEYGRERGRYREGGKVGEEEEGKRERGRAVGDREFILQEKFNWAEAITGDNGIYVNHQ